MLLLIKNQEFKRFCNSKNLDIVECLRSSFKNKVIFMRIQCECLLGIYGDSHCDCEHQKGETLKIINERTINTFLKIVEKINTDAIECLDAESKKMFLDTYNSIICGVEKVYTFNDSNITKVQNKFSCKVNNRIFGALKLVFRDNIFNRISSETSYFFYNIKENYSIRIRHSKVLDIKDGNSLYLRGQEYLQQTIFLNDKTKLVENEITKSKLKTYFENKDFLYNKKMDTIAFISEGELDGVNVYVKRVPNVENHIMDVYGKKEKILKFINSITTISDKTVLNMISNIQLEDEDLFDSNLSFGDKNTAIEEELMIYKLLNNE